MDQNKTILPCLWSQLSTQLFRGGERLVCGVIGGQFRGPTQTEFIVRTVVENCTHGADMQCSAILANLHLACMADGCIPEEFYIGADNTPKETKNQFSILWMAWLLCALVETPLWSVQAVFLLVGHTHGSLDRFFSHLSRVLMGKSYFTVADMWGIVTKELKSFNIKPAHLYCSWNWKQMKDDFDLPDIGGLRHAHVLNVYRSQGIQLRWKQFMTDEGWSRSVMLVPPHKVNVLGRWRPGRHDMLFQDTTARYAWLDKFEAYLADVHGTSFGYKSSLAWLRDVVSGGADVCRGPGVDEMVSDLLNIAARRVPQRMCGQLPHDIVTSFFPGSDTPHVPVDTLVKVTGAWQPETLPSVLGVGSPLRDLVVLWL